MALHIASRLKADGVDTVAGTMSEKNLRKQIGLLAQGDARWWAETDHSAARAAFIALVPEVVGLMPRPELVSNAYAFREFPELPQMNLVDEVPPTLGSPTLKEIVQAKGAHWIFLPRGAGRTLVAAWLRTQEDPRVVALTVDTLAQGVALPSTADSLLVLDVARSDEGDLDACRLLLRRDVVVLAPFTLPVGLPYRGPSEEGSTGVSSNFRGSQVFSLPRDYMSGMDENKPHWIVHRWKPLSGWRRWFIGWCANRIGRANFDPSDIADALNQVDPHEDWFGTPGAVLYVVASAQRGELPRTTTRTTWSESRLPTSVVTRLCAQTGDPWLRAHGAPAVRALIRSLLDRIDLPLDGPLAHDDVATLIEPAVSPTGSDHPLEPEGTAPTGDGATAVQRLILGGVLAAESANVVSLQPVWLTAMLAHDQVRVLLRTEPSHNWGRWCLEPLRRALVDGHLDGFNRQDFRRMVLRTLEEHDAKVLGSVAAIETVFAATARRMNHENRSSAPLDADELTRVWTAQMAHVTVRHDNAILAPTTRRAPGDTGPSGLEWVANCWSWSLCAKKPLAAQLEGAEWQWPGWAEQLNWSTNPQWLKHLTQPTTAERDRDRWNPHFRRMLELGPAVLALASGPVLEPPALFYPILLARQDPTDDLSGVANAVLDRAPWWAQIEFTHWLSSADRTQLQRVGAGLLDALSRKRGALQALHSLAGAAPEVLDALDAATVLGALKRHTDEIVKQPDVLLRVLPQQLQAQVLRDLIAQLPALGREICLQLDDWMATPLPLPVLMDLLSLNEAVSVLKVARAVWRVAERDEVVLATLREFPTGSRAAGALWYEAPEPIRARLVQMICEGDLVAPQVEWFEGYLRRAVLSEPAIAERAFALLQRLQA